MLRVALQAGIVDVFHLWLAFQPLGDAQRAVAVAACAGPCADAAQRQEAAERIENAADRVLQETELLRQRRVIPTAATPATTSEAVEVFGGGVHHHVKAQIQRTLQIRRSEGIVRHADKLMLLAIAAMALRSASFSKGLVGVSTQIILVSGSIACSSPARSAGDT